MTDAILIGGGGHAKSVADAVKRGGQYNIVGIVTKEEENLNGYPWLGNDDRLGAIFDSGIKTAIFAIGYLGKGNIREKVFNSLINIGFDVPAIIDPSAVLAEGTVLGKGTFVGKGAIINAGSVVNEVSIINTGAVIDHECNIGAYTHIAVGAKLCGAVKIGARSMVGAGATVIQCKNIGNDVLIGAGAVVISDIKDKMVAVGVPAVAIKENV
ncbi:MAG: NeuD/PglB/VioB family sugar acetyltransferase [Lachnospiraceae bacterium]|nr:NeuD/PglB/VioB family sugar acetyltransferase [Lachnospiraceae bacterium]